MFKLAVIALIMSLGFNEAYASCQCFCIGGRNQPICDSYFDVRPFCPPKFC